MNQKSSVIQILKSVPQVLTSDTAVRMMDQHIIETIEEAQYHTTLWLWTNNNDRPNMGIGGITPAIKLRIAG